MWTPAILVAVMGSTTVDPSMAFLVVLGDIQDLGHIGMGSLRLPFRDTSG